MPEAATYSSISLALLIDTKSASTCAVDSTQRNAACENVAPGRSYGRMSFRRAPISVFIAITPMSFFLAFSSTRGRSGWIADQ